MPWTRLLSIVHQLQFLQMLHHVAEPSQRLPNLANVGKFLDAVCTKAAVLAAFALTWACVDGKSVGHPVQQLGVQIW